MAQLLEFPDSGQRNRAEAERAIYAGLRSDGLNDSAIARVVDLFLPFWLIVCDDLNLDLSVPGDFGPRVRQDIESAVARYQKQLYRGTGKLLRSIYLLCVAKAIDESPQKFS